MSEHRGDKSYMGDRRYYITLFAALITFLIFAGMICNLVITLNGGN